MLIAIPIYLFMILLLWKYLINTNNNQRPRY